MQSQRVQAQQRIVSLMQQQQRQEVQRSGGSGPAAQAPPQQEVEAGRGQASGSGRAGVAT